MHDQTLPPATNDGRNAQMPPAMPFLQMQNSPDGGSTIAQRLLEGFEMRSVSGDTAPIWMRQFPGTVSAVWFNILPVGWVGDWHPSPSLQWVVPLSGRWFVETHDGKRIEMGPGDIHWGADLASENTLSRKGHLSGQIGDVPCVQMMIQFAETPDGDVATHRP